MRRLGFFIRYIWIVGLLWLGGMTLLFTPKDERVSESENRTLAGMPQISMESIWDGTFMQGMEAWLSDGIALRDGWIDLSRRAMEALAVPNSTEQQEEQALAALAEEEWTLGMENASDALNETAILEQEAKTTTFPTPAGTETVDEPREDPNADTVAPSTEAPPTPAVRTEGRAIRKTSFWIRYRDGSVREVYQFPVENVRNAANALNAYRALLPEDGNVIFAEVPIAATGNSYLNERDRRECWGSDMEEELQALAADGVHIVNGTAAMLEPLQNGEYVYFRTDHHWTALGAYQIYRVMMERLGIPPMAYADYAYTVKRGFIGSVGNSASKSSLQSQADVLEVPEAILPTKSFVVRKLTEQKEIEYMYPNRSSYTAFIGGTHTPWRRFVSGAQTGRTALLIGDSFSNALLPYLVPHYDCVMMTDLRASYYKHSEAGASIRAYIEMYGVDDVYFVFCFATSINSGFFTGGQVTRYLN